MLVVGGRDSSETIVYNDLWSYDPQSDSWSQLDNGSGAFTARFRLRAAWDATNNMLYIHGGGASGSVASDLWSYQVTATTTTTTAGSGSVVGDPVTYFGGKRVEFRLPQCLTTLIKTPDMELLGEPFTGLQGEQWIGKVVVRDSHGGLVAVIEIKRDIALYQARPEAPKGFATLDVTFPGLQEKALETIPFGLYVAGGLTLSCAQMRSLRRSPGAPPREAIFIQGEKVQKFSRWFHIDSRSMFLELS